MISTSEIKSLFPLRLMVFQYSLLRYCIKQVSDLRRVLSLKLHWPTEWLIDWFIYSFNKHLLGDTLGSHRTKFQQKWMSLIELKICGRQIIICLCIVKHAMYPEIGNLDDFMSKAFSRSKSSLNRLLCFSLSFPSLPQLHLSFLVQWMTFVLSNSSWKEVSDVNFLYKCVFLFILWNKSQGPLSPDTMTLQRVTKGCWKLQSFWNIPYISPNDPGMKTSTSQA